MRMTAAAAVSGRSSQRRNTIAAGTRSARGTRRIHRGPNSKAVAGHQRSESSHRIVQTIAAVAA
jgi:hypothetical protein